MITKEKLIACGIPTEKIDEILQNITNHSPNLVIGIGEHQCTVAHYAVWHGKLDVLINLFRLNETIVDVLDIQGRSVAHYAAMQGNTDILDWICTNTPHLLPMKDTKGLSIAHLAMMAIHLHVLDWILEHKPDLLNDTSDTSENIAHYAAKIQSELPLAWILKNLPAALDKTYRNHNCAHFAARSGNLAGLQWILKNKSYLISRRGYNRLTIAHYAALSKDPAVLQWILDNKPNLLNKKDNSDSTFVYYFSMALDWATIEWTIAHKLDLLIAPDTDGQNVLHYAARYNRGDIVQALLRTYPELTKKLWVIDKRGKDSPHAIAHREMAPKPNQIRDTSLLEASTRIINHTAQPNDMRLLLAFREEWEEMLAKSDQFDQAIINNIGQFPARLQEIIKRQISLLCLKLFSFAEGIITRSQLNELCQIVKQSTPFSSLLSFSPPESPLITQLVILCSKIDNEALSTRQIHCLQLIMDDYQQGLLGARNSLNHLIVGKLLSSTTLSQLRPTVEVTAGGSISTGQFPALLQTLKSQIASLPLTADVKRIMQTVIVPGIETLLVEEDNIIAHIKNHYGDLYMLNDNLPLHTDNAPIDNPEAYRETLHQLLSNFFGAAQLAHSKGHLGGFFGKMSQGFCLEGRVDAAFTWVTTLSGILSFSESIDKFINNEYLPYTQVMLGITEQDASFIEPACDFIMKRHLNLPCLPDMTYAPEGEIKNEGVEKYLKDILAYENEYPTSAINQVILSLEKERDGYAKFFNFNVELKQIKINALCELKNKLSSGLSKIDAVREIKQNYPLALHGVFSRTKALLNRLESESIVNMP